MCRTKNEDVKVLVAVADYPNDVGGIASMYVHTRNKYYIKHNIDVTVLNFKTKRNYKIDDIEVISLETYKKTKNKEWDILISHAPNLRNHFRFITKYGGDFQRYIFFFHGHEVMDLGLAYPKPYKWAQKERGLRNFMQKIYDFVKLKVWHFYLPNVSKKSDFIFVSEWFFKQFERYVKLGKQDLNERVHIIYNSVGEIFENNTYPKGDDKEFDFISIRSYMDKPKYCVDVIHDLAMRYPKYKFLIIGKGEFYKVHNIPDNVVWLEQYLRHDEILEQINRAKCALLPTRLDAQGVMMCEFATYGIPVITSNIEVCEEVFSNIKNVEFIENDVALVDLEFYYNKLLESNESFRTDKFSYKNTVALEERIIKGIK